MKLTKLLTRTLTPALLATLVLAPAVHALPDPDGKGEKGDKGVALSRSHLHMTRP